MNAMARRGIIIVFTLLGAALFVSIAAVLALYLVIGREPSLPSHALLTLRIGGDLAEVSPGDIVGFLRGSRAPTVRTVVDMLRKARVDSRITGVLLKPTGFDSPYWGKVQEIRDAVVDLKKAGKPVYAFLEAASAREYYLAAAADKVFLMPTATLDLTGVATYQVFLRGTLDKVGAVPDMHHIGEYKTAINTFTEKGYTKEHKEVDLALSQSVFDQLVRGVAHGRRKNESEVRQLVNEGPFLPEEALRAGLVDDLAYEDQVLEKLRALKADGVDARTREIDTDEYGRVSLGSVGLNRGPRMAVIYIVGTITGGKSGYDPVNGAIAGSETIAEYIRKARRDNSVRALIIRIDSPGGSAGASDAIWRELMIARNEREDRPIVVSMSDLAASGGYLAAVAAPTIVAQPATYTGSIGIFGGKIVTGGVYQKLGANIDSTSIGKNAEMDSPARPFNPSELKKLQEQLQAFYDQFVERVAQSRRTTPQKIDQLARGRVWTGEQAQENGLVDAIGGMDRAVALAKEKAKISADSDVELVSFPPRRNIYELVADQFSASGEAKAVDAWLSARLSRGELEALRMMRGPLAMFRRGEPLALMPFTFLR
jgi:protease-4